MTPEIPDHRGIDMFPALDRDHDLLGHVPIVLEEDEAIDPAIGPFFLTLVRLSIYKAAGPPLELILVPLGKLLRTFEIFRCADDLKGNP